MHHAEAAATAPSVLTSYTPKARDYRYVEATKHWLTLPPHQATRRKLAELAGMLPTALAGYEAHEPRMAWVRTQLAGERRDTQWEHLVDVAYLHARRGDVRWAIFFARATGRWLGEASDARPEVAGPSIVQVHIPRPELLPSPADHAKPVSGPATLLTTDVLDLTRR